MQLHVVRKFGPMVLIKAFYVFLDRHFACLFLYVHVYTCKYVVEYYGDREVYEYPGDVPVFLYLYNATKESDKPLTDFILTTWTNFAKSG